MRSSGAVTPEVGRRDAGIGISAERIGRSFGEDRTSAKTILYVEDNEVNGRLVRDLLNRTSYQLLAPPDGETGMATARQEI